ncbi:homoserine O-acetyltransferase [Fulvivirgaceae bacterium BMA10]|uniref:Homoserine O-acetyltransferase n=1 Tax=Splendidivirga corallicola TaxID=3051826 RepID=A0ABT8KNG5_9BACT|nr:homoserine O-acetyltransferase [Fulvivirgaceae bacterium BMA10]
MLANHLFEYPHEFKLESGKTLPGFQLAYTTYGELNKEKNNVVWVCHALTANSDFTEWWPDLFGPGKLYDPTKHFVICANMLGGCYGSTGPLSPNPRTGVPFFHSFPQITNRDVVNTFELLRNDLGLDQIHTILGGSMGGQQALEWTIEKPDLFENLVIVASNAKHSAWGIAFNETQRQAIKQDLTWKLNTERAGLNGMKVARAIALLSYRSHLTYDLTQSEETDEVFDGYKASSYQVYQGEKLASRFNAFTYWILSKAMDSHNVGRKREGIAKALKQIKANALFVGIDNDVLFPVKEQEFLAKHIENASFHVIDSKYGHDGFLIEMSKLTEKIQLFYKQKKLKPVLV